MTSDFWMKADCVAVESLRPSKKRTNGTLPPITATTSSAGQCRRAIEDSEARPCEPGTSRSRSSRTPATTFFAVV